jgi:vanillate O-demethylase monooxygenase subunit
MNQWIKNAWYVAAWGDEINRKPLRRIILEQPVVLYRTEDGKPVALEDRCCHRHYPLSRGELRGDFIQCGYHGMIYDQTGACVEIPWQEQVPETARVLSFPVVERDTFVWIWMGDPDKADPDEIVDYHWLNDDKWAAKGTRFHVKADYRLIVENLLDLTHLAYVHQSTIGNDAVAEQADLTVEKDDTQVTATRWMIDTPPPPTYVKAGGFVAHVDRWQIINFVPPANIRLDVGACDTGTGAPQGKRQGGIRMRNLNAITPETANTTHYFWAQAHNFKIDQPAVTDMIFEQVKTAFLEDKDVFEAQQENNDLNGQAARKINLSGDGGGIAALQMIHRRLEAEAGD